MSSAIRNLLSWENRNLGRHERIDDNDDEEDRNAATSTTTGGSEQVVAASTTAGTSSSVAAAAASGENVESSPSSTDIEEGGPSATSSEAVTNNNTETSGTQTNSADQTEPLDDLTFQNEENTEENDTEDNNENEENDTTTATTNNNLSRRMAELEEERELRRRRQSTCTIIIIFVLFRLWIEALAEGDVGLLFLCMLGTSWTAKWIRARREQEDEIDRRMEEYFRQAQRDGAENVNWRASSAEAELSLMSFQAQLALAILESQRQMMENGGFGNPDGDNGENRGVSEEARSRWSRYEYTPPEIESPIESSAGKVRKDGYGSVGTGDTTDGIDSNDNNNKKDIQFLDQGGEDEVPACSICLCEYEEGENLSRLPCGHVYHDECVTAWVTNHVRCPLCNFDLEDDELPSSSSTNTLSTDAPSSVRIVTPSDSLV